MGKKIFISYRFSGEDPRILQVTIPKLHQILKDLGHEEYSTFYNADEFEHDNWSGREIMDKAFIEIDKAEVVLFFVQSTAVSQGMLIELGYAMAKEKETVLVIKETIRENIFRRHIDKIITYEDLLDLREKLSDFEF